MAIAYSPTDNKGRISVAHLVAPNATFVAPTTFPECNTPLDYADSHAKVMSALADLHIESFDILFAKGPHVALRYSATGSHCGGPHNGIEKTGERAHWTASALFEVEGGKIKSFTKEWDKLHMWRQLGWMDGDKYV
jgi:predicted ester cyclase